MSFSGRLPPAGTRTWVLSSALQKHYKKEIQKVSQCPIKNGYIKNKKPNKLRESWAKDMA